MDSMYKMGSDSLSVGLVGREKSGKKKANKKLKAKRKQGRH